MTVQCPVCKRPDIETTMAFYVPGHNAHGTDLRCEGSNKGSKPNYSGNRNKQLCFKCGRYVSRTASFCPHCDK